ncbi:hypothetical protein [Cetobacterium sp.]
MLLKKNDINFIPKYNHLTLIGDVSYKDKPAAGYGSIPNLV